MRVASDIGGTFTDLIYLDEVTGEVGMTKASTTPHNFAIGVEDTLEKSGITVRDPVNCSRTGLHSGVRTIFKALTDPSIVANEGCFRPLKIICPDRTIFTCEKPAATSTWWETVLYVIDLVWKAMTPIVSDRLPTGHFLSVCGIVLSGNHPDTGELFILCEPQAGGWGAGHDKDGESGLVCVGDGETYIIVEMAKRDYGVIMDPDTLEVIGITKERGQTLVNRVKSK